MTLETDRMTGARRVNWWVISGLCLCLMVWAVGIVTVTKTAHLYEHRSNAGFRHDFIEHAREHWLSVKHIAAPPRSGSNSPT